LAAEAVLSFCGEPKRLLKPDLPAEGLARHWVRATRRNWNRKALLLI